MVERRFTLPTMIKAYEDLNTELWELNAHRPKSGHDPGGGPVAMRPIRHVTVVSENMGGVLD